MKVLLITTCVYNETNYSDFKRLVNSLHSQSSETAFFHAVLFQNYTQTEMIQPANNENYCAEHFYIKDIISLSKARNFIIERVFDVLSDYDYISFPDDDCWYPTSFWLNFEGLVSTNDCDLFYTKFCSSPIDAVGGIEKHSAYKLVQNASSNTTIYKSQIVAELRCFNESFGVGSENNGGEDTDFAIRAMLLSKNIWFSNSNLIGHRDPIAEFRYRYFKGSFGVLKNHCFSSLALMLITARKTCVGLVFLFSNKIKVTDFFIR
ncbi:glycosyltransferase family A protein [Shewanella sp. UCD-KL21]|uniref:glycosyltransferase family A protein n=1 Tax=Shewanella sp. UCD-KL21 TaxID=1917164 RepID=UPI000970DCEA|nr:glycosyltransferase family A protein [Shewanella sp. UCD-KL21]